jgi:hypothetical protein
MSLRLFVSMKVSSPYYIPTYLQVRSVLRILIVINTDSDPSFSLIQIRICITESSVAGPDPYVFGPPGSGSDSQRYGSGSFYHQAKIVKPLIPTVL